jgi:PBP1b-binding outer membrane lipoprotein LpoB
MLTRIVVIMLVGLALVLSGCEKKTEPAATEPAAQQATEPAAEKAAEPAAQKATEPAKPAEQGAAKTAEQPKPAEDAAKN